MILPIRRHVRLRPAVPARAKALARTNLLAAEVAVVPNGTEDGQGDNRLEHPARLPLRRIVRVNRQPSQAWQWLSRRAHAWQLQPGQ